MAYIPSSFATHKLVPEPQNISSTISLLSSPKRASAVVFGVLRYYKKERQKVYDDNGKLLASIA